MSEERVEQIVTLKAPVGYAERSRIDRYLARFLPNVSRTRVRRGIEAGLVAVNGETVRKPSHVVQAGDTIVCTLLRPPPIEARPEPIPLDIAYEDDAVIVVNKPAGMVVHPAYGHREGTLVNALLHHVGAGPVRLTADSEADPDVLDIDQDYASDINIDISRGNNLNLLLNDGSEIDPDSAVFSAEKEDNTGLCADEEKNPGLSVAQAFPVRPGDPSIRPGVVHRLDKDTSGLLVVAKDDAAHRHLARQFAERTVERRYLAALWGFPDPPAGRIEGFIGRDPRDRKRMAPTPSDRGKRAVTHYETLERLEYAALVAFRLETGRTHQIRVHAQHMGHPVFGDETYGGRAVRFGPVSSRRKAFAQNLFARLGRQALHAETLAFAHPRTERRVSFRAEVPPDMQYVIECLRRGGADGGFDR